ncbi:uncharacterized protein LOC108032534 [Drosophila biarmipes]|uniref:uncharacterized protein LOC108032534 n=1 Tax=Drosophila biarmipes TaxID=125945 RepID=UPI0007E6BA9F|nr:uncharacterized protein LOC108032534 [Drosophila biarmipes]
MSVRAAELRVYLLRINSLRNRTSSISCQTTSLATRPALQPFNQFYNNHSKMASYICTQFLNLNVNDLPSKTTTYTLNAARFQQRDLNLFIESLETISRLEKERHERRQLRKEKKLQQARMTQLEDERCSSPTPSADEAADEPILYLEAKCIPYQVSEPLSPPKMDSTPGLPEYYTCDDEAYGSVSPSARSSVTYCSCAGVASQHSDSRESGLSVSPTPPQLRPRSVVISQSQSKHRSTRSRIISMVLKKEYGKCPENLQTRDISEDIREEYRGRSTISKNSPEPSFLNKALRYLTL